MNFASRALMSDKFQKLFVKSNESNTSDCNVSGLSECKKWNVLPLFCSSTSFKFVGSGCISKISYKVIALYFWSMILYSGLDDCSPVCRKYHCLMVVSEVVSCIDVPLNCNDFELIVAVVFQLHQNCWQKRLGIRRMFPLQIHQTFLPFPKSFRKYLQI